MQTRVLLAVSVLLSALALVMGCGSSAADEPASEAEMLQQEVEQRIESAVAAGFSGVVLVTVDGQSVAHSAHGLADRERELENRTDTAFDVGSIMKDLTATAVFALQQGGHSRSAIPSARFSPKSLPTRPTLPS